MHLHWFESALQVSCAIFNIVFGTPLHFTCATQTMPSESQEELELNVHEVSLYVAATKDGQPMPPLLDSGLRVAALLRRLPGGDDDAELEDLGDPDAFLQKPDGRPVDEVRYDVSYEAKLAADGALCAGCVEVCWHVNVCRVPSALHGVHAHSNRACLSSDVC